MAGRSPTRRNSILVGNSASGSKSYSRHLISWFDLTSHFYNRASSSCQVPRSSCSRGHPERKNSRARGNLRGRARSPPARIARDSEGLGARRGKDPSIARLLIVFRSATGSSACLKVHNKICARLLLKSCDFAHVRYTRARSMGTELDG